MSISSKVKNRWGQRGPVSGVRFGTAGVGTRAYHYTSDGFNIVTRLVVNATMPDIVGGTNLSVGVLIWTFPAGVHSLKIARLSIALQQTEGNITSDQCDLGLGDVVGSGANVALSSVGASENILTGQTTADCDGTVEEKTIVLGTSTHIVSESGDKKPVWLNVADGWASGGDEALGAVGEVWLEWTRLSGV